MLLFRPFQVFLKAKLQDGNIARHFFKYCDRVSEERYLNYYLLKY